MIDVSAVLAQIDSVLGEWEKATSHSSWYTPVGEAEASQIITRAIAAIDRLSPSGSSYRTNCKRIIDRYGPGNLNIMEAIIGILKALRADYEAGYLKTIQELIHADMFSDFLDAATYLLDEGYEDPAAVMVGGVLEEHLRKICTKNNIPVDDNSRLKKADRLNSELAASSTYDKLSQKSVTAWLDLRNKAAHGRYGEYTKEQVALMLQGVRDFISRYPA